MLVQLPSQEKEEEELLCLPLAGVGAEAGEDPQLQLAFRLWGLQLLLGEDPQ